MIYSVDNKSYVFAVEKVTDILDELKPMLAEHHDEIQIFKLPFNPDYERYLYLDSVESLITMSIRLENRLVGYAVFFLNSQIYQKDVISATQSLNFVDKGHRGIGYQFMKFCDDILEKRGVNSIWRHTPICFDAGKVFNRMGYTLMEKTYLKEFL